MPAELSFYDSIVAVLDKLHVRPCTRASAPPRFTDSLLAGSVAGR